LIRAEGTGITGGDPLLEMDRAERMIRLLKEKFGEEHHIHLYTAIMDVEKVERLVKAGLDEVRFHPMPEEWEHMEQHRPALMSLLDLSVDVGVEIPSLPDMKGAMCNLAAFLDGMDVLFLNINELEFSEENYDNLLGRGYLPRDDVSAAMDQSREAAMSVLTYAEEEDLALSVHYCSSGFKDGVQLRNRLIRRAETIARPMDVVTEDGTILKGVVDVGDLDPSEVREVLLKKLAVKEGLMAVDRERGRLEVAPWVLEKKVDKVPFQCYIVEEYPTWDHLEVERTPLQRSSRKRSS
ncbi:MAG: radical SAM protein, partial [Thermoplasmata archaeon]|nr:radical SAM protein [Thermoplasmata archaeon]